MFDITKESIGAIKEKLSTVAILVIPGMTVLDIVLRKGLFGQQPSSLSELILYLFWCVSLSAILLIPVISTAYRCQYVTDSLKEKNAADKPHDKGESYLFTYGFLISMVGALSCIVFFNIATAVVPTKWFPFCGLTKRFVVFSSSIFFADICSFIFAFPYWKHIEEKTKSRRRWIEKIKERRGK